MLYEQKMIEAMSILVNGAIQKLKFDKSIQAEIFQIVNPEIAEYKVKYAGNIFTAYSNDLNYKYKVGDTVWVKVPEGDFSNKKFIENKVSARTVPSGVVDEQIFNLTPPVAEFTATGNIAGVRSRFAQKDTWSASKGDLAKYLHVSPDFTLYSKGYNNFQIKAKFTTKFKQPLPEKGNYGLKVQFTTLDPQINPSFVLDRTFFLGDYYNNAIEVEQSGEFSVADGVILTGISSVELFAENFDVNKEDYKDIFLNSFTMTYIDIVDLNNIPFYLKLSTPEGFNGNHIKAKAQLFVQGELQDENNYTIQWYEQDYEVTSSSDKYNKAAGFGWAKIDGATTSELSLERKRYTNKYKAVAHYEKTDVSATIQIIGLNTETLQMVRRENRLTILTLDEQEASGSLSYYWYASMPNGSYIKIEQSPSLNYLDIDSYLAYDGIVFYCEVRDSLGVFARISSLNLLGESASGDIGISFIGEEFFNYDANGDVTSEDALREKTLTATINWGDYPEPKRYEIKWLAPDGVELVPLTELPSSDNKHNCENSQIEQMWVDSNDILHYNIKRRYSITNINNTIGLKLYDLDSERDFLFKKILTFTKDGDTGTNGTTYAARIAYCDVNGVVRNGFGGLSYNSSQNKWSTEYVRILIYHNGEELTPTEYQDWNLTWQGKNVIIGDGNEETSKGAAKVSITSSGSNYQDEHYIRVSAQYRGPSQENVNINLYPHFAVDVYVGNLNLQYLDVTEIPQSIIYSSSGVNPKFYNKALKIKYWNNETKVYDEFRGSNKTLSISPLGNLTITKQKKDLDYYLDPFENINDANGKMPVYSCEFKDFTIYHTTLLYINTYGNEAINGWDGISIKIDEDGGNIFAPQVGAGIKNADNTFTGVVMGRVGDASASSGSSVYGLYGYNAGKNTFYVTEKGDCYLKGKISSAEGEIGGWKITNNALFSTGDTARPGSASPSSTDKNIRFQSNGTFSRNLLSNSFSPSNLKFAIGDKFAVDEEGILYSGGARIKASQLSITVDDSDKDVKEYIDESASGVDKALKEYFDKEANNLQTQIDGKIETWAQEADPSLAWSSTEEKTKHKGDIWYASSGTKTWNGNSWEDTKSLPPDVLKDTWDGKKTIFSFVPPQHPNPPYEKDDLWVQGTSGDIKYCKTAKTQGQTYAESDWVKADQYINDAQAQAKVDALDKTLDDSFEIFERLTKNYKVKGLISDPESKSLYLNADAIHTGAIKVSNPQGKETFYANYADGTVRINADQFTINAKNFSLTDDSSGNLAQKFTDLSNSIGKSQNLIITLSNEYESIPCDSAGNPSISVNVSSEIYVYYGSKDVSTACTLTSTTSGVIGTLDASNRIAKITRLDSESGYMEIFAKYVIDGNTITTSKRLNVAKVRAGANGANGAPGAAGKNGQDARVYYMEPSVHTIVYNPNTKIYTPTKISFQCFYRDGQGDPQLLKDGQGYTIVLNTKEGAVTNAVGSEWDLTTYLKNNNSSFSFELCKDGGILDKVTIPVISDGTDGEDGRDITEITDKELFNALTNNGAVKGIFQADPDGHGSRLMINADYIKSGTISGDLIKGGTIEGITINGSTITGGEINGVTLEGVRFHSKGIGLYSQQQWAQLNSGGIQGGFWDDDGQEAEQGRIEFSHPLGGIAIESQGTRGVGGLLLDTDKILIVNEGMSAPGSRTFSYGSTGSISLPYSKQVSNYGMTWIISGVITLEFIKGICVQCKDQVLSQQQIV